jgi:hypothetical protein
MTLLYLILLRRAAGIDSCKIYVVFVRWQLKHASAGEATSREQLPQFYKAHRPELISGEEW